MPRNCCLGLKLSIDIAREPSAEEETRARGKRITIKRSGFGNRTLRLQINWNCWGEKKLTHLLDGTGSAVNIVKCGFCVKRFDLIRSEWMKQALSFPLVRCVRIWVPKLMAQHRS